MSDSTGGDEPHSDDQASTLSELEKLGAELEAQADGISASVAQSEADMADVEEYLQELDGSELTPEEQEAVAHDLAIIEVAFADEEPDEGPEP